MAPSSSLEVSIHVVISLRVTHYPHKFIVRIFPRFYRNLLLGYFIQSLSINIIFFAKATVHPGMKGANVCVKTIDGCFFFGLRILKMITLGTVVQNFGGIRGM